MTRELYRLHSRLKAAYPEVTVRTVLGYLRRQYIWKSLGEGDRRLLERVGCGWSEPDLTSDEQRVVSGVGAAAFRWDDWHWHIANRIHLQQDSSDEELAFLFTLIGDLGTDQALIRRLLLDGVDVSNGEENKAERRYYDLSILPMNLLLGDRVLRYYLPPSDYLRPHPTKKADPYGLLWAPSRAATAAGLPVAVVSPTGALLGAHKFSHTLLMNIDFYCPIGCSDCYKSRFGTREYLESRQPKLYRNAAFGTVRPPSAAALPQHASDLVAWLNTDPRGQSIHDVIVSGGEPFVLPNDTIAVVLEEMAKAKNLRVLRFCTGTLFLGLPMRIDEELADLLGEFTSRTGVRVTVQAHLACHEQIVPETLIAVSRLRKRGISVYSQTPIKEGVNFFLDDPKATLAALIELGRRQVAVGVESYMFIVDMHPSTNAFYVPIEPLMAVWGALVESHEHPGLERPRTLSILFEGGNIILSGATLFAAQKLVDHERGVVTYRIPRVCFDNQWRPDIAEVFEYSEPIGAYNDDPDSLKKLQARWEALRLREDPQSSPRPTED